MVFYDDFYSNYIKEKQQKHDETGNCIEQINIKNTQEEKQSPFK